MVEDANNIDNVVVFRTWRFHWRIYYIIEISRIL